MKVSVTEQDNLLRIPRCHHCLEEIFDQNSRMYLYPYTSCRQCDINDHFLSNNMKNWIMCDKCLIEYNDSRSRRYQYISYCQNCGPQYKFAYKEQNFLDTDAYKKIAKVLHNGEIIAIKGIGGYHLVCDATNDKTVERLRNIIRRPAKPFAVMVKNITAAHRVAHLSKMQENMLVSAVRPIVIARSKRILSEFIAPKNNDIGIMLPYHHLHHILFHHQIPDNIVMTSANFPGQPTIYDDDDIYSFASQFDDAVLIGEHTIIHSVDDAVTTETTFGPMTIRRGRAMTQKISVSLPASRPILSVGADLKNTITLIHNGQTITSHHIGDLATYEIRLKLEQTIEQLLDTYHIKLKDTIIGYDLHPQFISTEIAKQLKAYKHIGVQHHKAHLASVLAEKNALDKQIIGIVLDGTGYGTNGEIWGGEIFIGSVTNGFKRYGHLKKAQLIGGDVAAQFPLQALAGFFVNKINDGIKIGQALRLPKRFFTALNVLQANISTHPTTSMGRFFDAMAAILGYHTSITYEGEAAIWLEHLARPILSVTEEYNFPWKNNYWDYEPLLQQIINDKLSGIPDAQIARNIHRSIAKGIVQAIHSIMKTHNIDTVVLSGGVFQNQLLLTDIHELLQQCNITCNIWMNEIVPPNDNGISLGQAALISSMK